MKQLFVFGSASRLGWVFCENERREREKEREYVCVYEAVVRLRISFPPGIVCLQKRERKQERENARECVYME